MTVKEMFAAFMFDKDLPIPEYGFDEDPVSWARERLGGVGLPLRVSTPALAPQMDGLPAMSTDWLGTTAEVRVVDHAEYRALVLVVSASEVHRKVAREGEGYQVRVAEEFRDLCDAIAPTYAFFQVTPVDVIPDFLDVVVSELLGLYLRNLVRFGFPLWYVNKVWAQDIPFGGRIRLAHELPARDGVVALHGDSLANWL